MTDFEVWFEVNKITSNRKPDMEGLKDLFEKCWEDCSNKYSDNEELQNTIEQWENDYSELEEDYENMKKTVSVIKNEVEDSDTLEEAQMRVKDYDY